MLEIVVPEREYYDNEKGFIKLKPQLLLLEHSLLSISKWEAKYQRPFIDHKPKSNLESLDYIKMMTINRAGITEEVYEALTQEMKEDIFMYIESNQTATIITDRDKATGGRNTIVTSELIYYWLISLQIPFDVEKWHINRLLTLIRICDAKSKKPKKMSSAEAMSQQRQLNALRREQYGTKG